jgi:tight adherence protein C
MALTKRLMASALPVPSVNSYLVLRDIALTISSRLKKTRQPLMLELPEFLRVFALLLANGLPVGVAISWLAPKLQGVLGQGLTAISLNLELGADLSQELRQLAKELPVPAIFELTEKLSASLERGAPIANQISQLAQSVALDIGRDLTKKAGSNETKMLIPTIFLILPVTVLFAVFPSVLVLQNQL